MLLNFIQSMRVKPASLALLASFTLALAACGGGGGSPGASNTPPTLAVTVVNPAGATVTSISTTSPAFARATVRDNAGRGVANTVVHFVGGGIDFTPVSGTVLTDGAGVATVGMLASAAAINGATEISASASVGDQPASGKIGITLVVPPPVP